MKLLVCGAVAALTLLAEVRTVTFREALDLASKQNPDLVLAKLDERKAQENVNVARDPFTPRIGIGSGLAYNNGFPLSIEGSAPSIFRAQAQQYLYNRQQTWIVAKARENARGAGIAAGSKQDEAMYRVAGLYLDAARARRNVELAAKQVEALDKIATVVRQRVEEGRELEIEAKRAALNLARARQRVELFENARAGAERALAGALGMDEADRAEPSGSAAIAADLPASEDAAVVQALAQSKELRKLESDLLAEGLDIKSQKAARLPRIDLVAQYGLFSRYNNFDDYFRTFQRHNGLIGMSFQIPVLVGPAVSALSQQAEVNRSRLQVERNAARSRIGLEARRAWRQLGEAKSGAEVSRLDLDVAREQLSVLLAKLDEGRASLKEVEEARFAESEKWLAFYDAQDLLERARLDLMKQSGTLASLR